MENKSLNIFNTALVLAKLEQAAPGFACHVYAISGVSGGSLGAAVYAAELADRSDGFDCTGPGGGPGVRLKKSDD